MKTLLLLAAVLVLAVGAGGWWFLLREDAPERAALTDQDKNGGDETSGLIDPNGNWVAQPGDAEGDDLLSDDAPGSWAGFRVDEELRAVDVTAVGRTNDVSGQLSYADGSVVSASFEVDMATLQSDEGKRDDAIRNQGIETNEFPTASFELTQPLKIAIDGKPFAAKAVGQLTLHGVTKEATITIEGQQLGDSMEIVGRTEIVMADYDIEPITLAFVKTSDEGELEVKLLLVKG